MSASRRLFLAAGLAAKAATGPVYRIATRSGEISLSVQFHDRYSSQGFWFRDAGGHFCLSLAGEKDRDCARRFVGALAIARYEIRSGRISTLREHVLTIDRDERLDQRPPFDRKLALQGGVASDIQAFGYEHGGPEPSVSPWYYFRQDLFVDGDAAAFLTVHWKHTLAAIRILDMIPGDGTCLYETPRR